MQIKIPVAPATNLKLSNIELGWSVFIGFIYVLPGALVRRLNVDNKPSRRSFSVAFTPVGTTLSTLFRAYTKFSRLNTWPTVWIT